MGARLSRAARGAAASSPRGRRGRGNPPILARRPRREERMARTRLVATLALCGAAALGGIARGDGPARPTDAYLDQTRARWEEAARKIWGFAETSLQEKQSAS